MQNELEKEDYEQLLLLIKISERIFYSYIELAKLEILNKKESQKFKSELNNLNTLLKLEREIIRNINPTKIYRIIEEVNKQIGCLDDTFDIIDIIIENKTNILPLERVSKQLKEYVITIFSKANTETKEDEEIDTELEHLKKSMESSAELIKNLENDKWLILISLLNLKICNTEDQELKSKLIRSKYYLSFLIPSIELNLLNNNFKNQQDIFFSTDLTAAIYNISPTILTFQKEDLGTKTFIEQVNKLLNIKNEEYKEKQLEVLIRESLIRMSFQFLNEEQVKELKEKIKRKIENYPNLKGYESSIEIIEGSFRLYRKDRTLIKKVSLVQN